MLWKKTPAGEAEAKRVLIQSPVTRNLLMVIDGTKSEELLLGHLIGVKAQDFRTLHQHGLIEPVLTGAANTAQANSAPSRPSADPHLATLLLRVIAAHLGVGGLVLTTSIQRGQTLDELHELARMIIAAVERRKGKDVAERVRIEIFGR